MSASIYLRDGVIYLCPVFQTSSGGLEGEPVMVLDPKNPEDIGKKLVEVLEISKNILANPEEITKNPNQVVKSAKLKSYKKFVEGAKNLDAGIRDGKFIFWPTRNGGATGPTRGFHFLPEKESSIVTTDPAELGRVILAAFDDCE